MQEQGHPENRYESAEPLSHVCRQEWTDGDAAKETGVKVSEGDAAAGGWCAVCGVGVGYGHGADERAAHAVDEGSEEEPWVTNCVGIGGAEDGDDLVTAPAEYGDAEKIVPSVSI